MSVELITSGTIQNPPYDELITIKAFEVKDVFYDFNYFRVTEGVYSRGDIEYRFSETGQPAKFVAGQAIKLNQVVQRVSIRNTTDEDITITIALGIGDIFDDRLSVSGQLQVVNGVGDTLSTQDLTTQNLIETLLGSAMFKIGDNYESASSNGVFTLINNTSDNPASGDGVWIRTFSADNPNNGALTQLMVGGNTIYRLDTNPGRSANCTIRFPLYIPAGLIVSVNNSAGSGLTALTWDNA